MFRLVLFCMMLLVPGMATSALPCHGKFPNPITDVCWKCMFPLTIGPVTVNAPSGFSDAGDKAPAVCACPMPPPVFIRIGIGTGFWEPARMAEGVTTPFCSPTLGGVNIGSSMMGPLVKRGDTKVVLAQNDNKAFMHVHWYQFPLMNWLSLMTNTACNTNESFDILMLSELEPSWENEELAFLLAPEAILFSTPQLVAACVPDCVAASAGVPLDPLFWCTGCQAGMYPLSGYVMPAESGIEASLTAIQRMHFKLHRVGVALDMGSKESMCISLPKPIMRRSMFRTQMTYPIPNTFSAHPYGRSTELWAAGREYPIKGEQFAYIIWRKRLCCAF